MYLGETSFLELTRDKVCTVLSVEKEWYRIVDDTDAGCLYPPEEFESVEPNDGSTPVTDWSTGPAAHSTPRHTGRAKPVK